MHAERRQYAGLIFAPGQGTVVDGRLNLWTGWGIDPRKGSWRLLRRHIWKVLANRDPKIFKYQIKWIAWTFQNPGEQAETALVIRGGRGTGKGLLGRALREAFGQHGLQISSPDLIVGRFTGHLEYCEASSLVMKVFGRAISAPKDKSNVSLPRTR